MCQLMRTKPSHQPHYITASTEWESRLFSLIRGKFAPADFTSCRSVPRAALQPLCLRCLNPLSDICKAKCLKKSMKLVTQLHMFSYLFIPLPQFISLLSFFLLNFFMKVQPTTPDVLVVIERRVAAECQCGLLVIVWA